MEIMAAPEGEIITLYEIIQDVERRLCACQEIGNRL